MTEKFTINEEFELLGEKFRYSYVSDGKMWTHTYYINGTSVDLRIFNRILENTIQQVPPFFRDRLSQYLSE